MSTAKCRSIITLKCIQKKRASTGVLTLRTKAALAYGRPWLGLRFCRRRLNGVELELLLNECFQACAPCRLVVENGFAVGAALNLLNLVVREVVGDNHNDIEFTEAAGVVLDWLRRKAELLTGLPAGAELLLDVKLPTKARTQQALDVFRSNDQKTDERLPHFLFSLLLFGMISAQKNNSELSELEN